MSNDADIATARRLSLGMNLVFVAAVLALVAGVVLEESLLVFATLGVFAAIVVAYIAIHVRLHRRVAAASGASVTRDDSIGGALALIRLNLVLYLGFVLVGVGAAVVTGMLVL
ncbi:hypothetical protein [Halomarina rubra]|uniref:Uncharacterized protein n=1 Tax=Halomarina rubra TaxID=2071873 RepID=A0ABD6B1Y8_9EURY|nr:hypothetical protein [Halomarina rubra]